MTNPLIGTSEDSQPVIRPLPWPATRKLPLVSAIQAASYPPKQATALEIYCAETIIVWAQQLQLERGGYRG